MAARRVASEADEKAGMRACELVSSRVVMLVVSKEISMDAMRAVEKVGEMVE